MNSTDTITARDYSDTIFELSDLHFNIPGEGKGPLQFLDKYTSGPMPRYIADALYPVMVKYAKISGHGTLDRDIDARGHVKILDTQNPSATDDLPFAVIALSPALVGTLSFREHTSRAIADAGYVIDEHAIRERGSKVWQTTLRKMQKSAHDEAVAARSKTVSTGLSV